MSQRGFTLVEMLVALVVSAAVGTLIVGVLVDQRRLWWEHTWRLDSHHTARFSQLRISRELQGTVGPLHYVGSGTVRYRAVRALYFTCAPTAAGGGTVTLRRNWVGQRAIDPAVDSLLVLLPNAGSVWRAVGIGGVGSGTCPDRAPGVAVTLAGPAPARIPDGVPLRSVETAEIRAYRSGSAWWIGMRRLVHGRWPATQPFVGPVSTRGLEFIPLDSSQSPVSSLARAAGVRVRVGLRNPANGAISDWARFTVALRNWR